MEELKAHALEAIKNSCAKMDPDYPLYHVAPPIGRLNDPNGLLADGDTYHAFYQFGPFFPHEKVIYWGHAVSTDLLHWEDLGPAVVPDASYDRNGTYSGSGLFAGKNSDVAQFALFYTGNVKDSQTGKREATQCLVTSKDLVHFEKFSGNPVIGDQPAGYTSHYRDPLVWLDHDGSYRMLIGVQRENLTGAAVFYRSQNLAEWHFEGEMIFPRHERDFATLGYMWECPNIVTVEDEETGEEYDLFIFCPQGVQPNREGFENIFPCVYLLGRLEGNAFHVLISEYRELDRGFEFYAPQVFARREGDSRTPLLMGWAGNAGEDAQPSLEKSGWVHTLTVPRELTARAGRIIQRPGMAWRQSHDESVQCGGSEPVTRLTGSRSFRLVVEPKDDASSPWGIRIGSENCHVDITLSGGQLIVDRSTTHYPHGDCRAVTLPGGTTERLEVLHDRSVTEIFAGDGDIAFTLRSFLDSEDSGAQVFSESEGRVFLLRYESLEAAQPIVPALRTERVASWAAAANDESGS